MVSIGPSVTETATGTCACQFRGIVLISTGEAFYVSERVDILGAGLSGLSSAGQYWQAQEKKSTFMKLDKIAGPDLTELSRNRNWTSERFLR